MGITSVRLRSVLLLLSTTFVQPPVSALTVTAPPTGSATVQAGNDFATQIIGDAWDMSNPQDVDTDESANLTGQTFSGFGVFSASASLCAATFWPQFTGDGSNIVATKRGPRFPIDTSTYRFFTIKIKTSTAQQDRLLFFKNGDTSLSGNFGSGVFKSLPANQWTIQTWDLFIDTYAPAPPDNYQQWTSFAQVQGIRFDPCNTGSPTIEVDWIRLTAPNVVGQSYNVSWTDTVNTMIYTITAIDPDGARYTFAPTSVGATSYSADFSRLEPGDYHVEVKRADNTIATSAGVVHVNAPPQVNITSPSVRGEQSKSYAVTQQGGQWGPIGAVDFAATPNFTNISYTNPAGSFLGRPTNNDPQFIMKTSGHLIDTSLYRSVCFTQEVFGTRSIGGGSVARLFWGPTSGSVSTTKDIILGNGLVEYCLPDLADTAAVPLEPGSPQPWTGSLGYFRMDPHELTPPGGCNTPQNCFDVRLDSIIVAPFAAANPAYTIHWALTDPDYVGVGSIQILLDPDTTFGNGNEIPIATVPYTSLAYTLVADQNIPNGTYYLVLRADDFTNAVAQYAGGKIVTNNSDVIFRDGFDLRSADAIEMLSD